MGTNRLRLIRRNHYHLEEGQRRPLGCRPATPTGRRRRQCLIQPPRFLCTSDNRTSQRLCSSAPGATSPSYHGGRCGGRCDINRRWSTAATTTTTFAYHQLQHQRSLLAKCTLARAPGPEPGPPHLQQPPTHRPAKHTSSSRSSSNSSTRTHNACRRPNETTTTTTPCSATSTTATTPPSESLPRRPPTTTYLEDLQAPIRRAQDNLRKSGPENSRVGFHR